MRFWDGLLGRLHKGNSPLEKIYFVLPPFFPPAARIRMWVVGSLAICSTMRSNMVDILRKMQDYVLE